MSVLSTSRLQPKVIGAFLDTTFNGVLTLNELDVITSCNAIAAHIFLLSQEAIIGLPIVNLIPNGLPQNPKSLNTHAVNGLGSRLSLSISLFKWEQQGCELKCLVLAETLADTQQETASYELEQRFHTLSNIAPVAIIQLNREWEYVFSNQNWSDFTELSPHQCKGTNWLKAIYSADIDNVLLALRDDPPGSTQYEHEFRLQAKSGKVTWVKVAASALHTKLGELSGHIMTFSDISDQISTTKQLKDIAKKDQLTGLVNRIFFNDRVEMALKGIRRFGAISLMLIDLDDFKHINETLGHKGGDQLLREVAQRITVTLRQVDTIARAGADEFTVLITNVRNTPSITAIADKLLQTLVDPFIINNRSIYVTCSIGISVIENPDTKSKQLLSQADSALQKAKTAGKNQYRFYTKELDQRAGLHVMLLQSLKEMDRGDFRLVYQPQVDAISGAVIGFEALTRWEHEDMEPISADIYIKMIEESGLIDVYSEWLLNEVFSTIQFWAQLPGGTSDTHVSINISAKQFRNNNLANDIYQRCCAYGVSPNRITLEVTETTLIDEPAIAATTLHALKDMGFGLALDDFGTGYSSLKYLKNMPLDIIKIDRSFIKDVTHDEADAKIVAAIIALAATLKLSVVAEGVENIKVKEWLIQHDCPCHQGFLYHKPMEPYDVMQILKVGPTRPEKHLADMC